MTSGRKLAHDWHDGVIPENVIFDDTNVIDSSHSFLRFKSLKDNALTLGHRTAIYSGSGFDLGPEGRVQIGAFTMINNARIICDEAIQIGDYGLISWNVVLMDNYRVPRSIEKRRAYICAILQNPERAFSSDGRKADLDRRQCVDRSRQRRSARRGNRERQHRRRALGCDGIRAGFSGRRRESGGGDSAAEGRGSTACHGLQKPQNLT